MFFTLFALLAGTAVMIIGKKASFFCNFLQCISCNTQNNNCHVKWFCSFVFFCLILGFLPCLPVYHAVFSPKEEHSHPAFTPRTTPQHTYNSKQLLPSSNWMNWLLWLLCWDWAHGSMTVRDSVLNYITGSTVPVPMKFIASAPLASLPFTRC